MSALIAPAPASAGGSGGVSSPSGTPSGSPPSPSSGGPTQNQGSPPAQTQGGEPSASQPTPAQQQAAERLRRTEKVNGKDVELEASIDELWAAKRQERSVHDRARKVAEERKAFEAERQRHADEVRRRKEDPFFDFREDPNFNEMEWLQQRLHRQLNDQNRDPRDLALAERDNKIRELERQGKEREAAEQRARDHAEENRQLAQLGSRFKQALDAGGLPENDLTLDIMAKAYFTAEDSEIDLSPVELVQETRRMLGEALDNCAEKMDGEKLLDMFPSFSKKLHAALVSRYKRMQEGGQPSQQNQQPPTANVLPKQEAGPARQTEQEYRRQIEKETGRRQLWGV